MQSSRHPLTYEASQTLPLSPNYFDAKEAARRFGLSESWLAKLRVKGGGPSHIKCGRRVLYEAKSFEDWLEAQRRSNTSEAPNR
jgi:hypothetical protein